jgi:flagellin-specific chaperone FliS
MDDCLISKSLARVEKLLTQAAAARDTEDFLHYLNNARQIVLSLRVVLDAEKDDGR